MAFNQPPNLAKVFFYVTTTAHIYCIQLKKNIKSVTKNKHIIF